MHELAADSAVDDNRRRGIVSTWLLVLRAEPHVAPWAALLLVAGAIPFFTSTTFIGDDHLFLAFAHHEPRPWRVLWVDLHGGEFYRPLPMLVWWCLGQIPLPGARWAFAALSFLIHATVALQTGAILWAVRSANGAPATKAAAIGAACFFLVPFAREAAYWYSASTDLLTTAFGLAAILALLRGAQFVAVVAFALACLCKETAIAIPAMAAIALWRARRASWPIIVRRLLPWCAVAAVYWVARTLILGGLGGSGDPPAPLWGRLTQIAAGAVQLLSGEGIWRQRGGWILGGAVWLVLASALVLRRPEIRARDPFSWILLWLLVALAPLVGAPWVVGARYFYAASVAGAFLVATALARVSSFLTLGVLATLGGLSLAESMERQGDVRVYDARVAAVRRAVADGRSRGHRVFHVICAIKDIDLAVKEDPALRSQSSSFLVLGDVPASFVMVPRTGDLDIAFLLADPPLPPSGAYRFGDEATHIVGLARLGRDPTLDEVWSHFPHLRLLRLHSDSRPGAAPRPIAVDVTEAWSRTNAADEPGSN